MLTDDDDLSEDSADTRARLREGSADDSVNSEVVLSGSEGSCALSSCISLRLASKSRLACATFFSFSLLDLTR